MGNGVVYTRIIYRYPVGVVVMSVHTGASSTPFYTTGGKRGDYK